MNFKKLQAMQAKLDEAILAEKAPMTAEERFNKTLVALGVEIAEVANTVEHFKFWKDNKGKVDSERFIVTPSIVNNLIEDDYLDNTTTQYVTEKQAHRLTLIEECSEALHFILSLASQCDYAITEIGKRVNIQEDTDSMEKNYLFLSAVMGDVEYLPFDFELEMVIDTFFLYVRQLGVADEELEQVYYDKNKINYERLANGY